MLTSVLLLQEVPRLRAISQPRGALEGTDKTIQQNLTVRGH